MAEKKLKNKNDCDSENEYSEIQKMTKRIITSKPVVFETSVKVYRFVVANVPSKWKKHTEGLLQIISITRKGAHLVLVKCGETSNIRVQFFTNNQATRFTHSETNNKVLVKVVNDLSEGEVQAQCFAFKFESIYDLRQFKLAFRSGNLDLIVDHGIDYEAFFRERIIHHFGVNNFSKSYLVGTEKYSKLAFNFEDSD